VETYCIRLGYWRKHASLHGYTVQTFAGGVDEGQSIELGKAELEKSVEAIRSKSLPHTTGFFFGVADGSKVLALLA
jgi:hypothetical protein